MDSDRCGRNTDRDESQPPDKSDEDNRRVRIERGFDALVRFHSSGERSSFSACSTPVDFLESATLSQREQTNFRVTFLSRVRLLRDTSQLFVSSKFPQSRRRGKAC